MFKKEIYQQRRKLLATQINDGIIVIAGNNHCARNYGANTFKFRQDSNFLYFAGIDLPGLYLIIDAATGESTLYGNESTLEDHIWMGSQSSLADWSEKSGIEKIKPLDSISALFKSKATIHYLPPYPSDRKMFFSEMLGKSVQQIETGFSLSLVKAVIAQRSVKSELEINEIEDSFEATEKFHVEAMKMAMPGEFEYTIAGQIEGTMIKNQCSPAFQVICTVHGEILHNEFYANQLKKGQLLLVDAGAENRMHYASDITRTTPVGGRFSEQQKNIYEIVLKAQTQSISAIKPGVKYQQIHLEAARTIASGLVDLGLMKGNPSEIVELGAHAMFFPHGLGHMMGLDVHDMEDLGENNVGYDNTVQRSKQFGTAYLRMAKELKPGYVMTVEPGIYFIPILIEKWKSEKIHTDKINYKELEKYISFGGIRIEDNILVTNESSRLLGNPIPKTIKEIETIFG